MGRVLFSVMFSFLLFLPLCIAGCHVWFLRNVLIIVVAVSVVLLYVAVVVVLCFVLVPHAIVLSCPSPFRRSPPPPQSLLDAFISPGSWIGRGSAELRLH